MGIGIGIARLVVEIRIIAQVHRIVVKPGRASINFCQCPGIQDNSKLKSTKVRIVASSMSRKFGQYKAQYGARTVQRMGGGLCRLLANYGPPNGPRRSRDEDDLK